MTYPTTTPIPAGPGRRLVHGGPRGYLHVATLFEVSNVETDRLLTRLEGRAAPYDAWTNRGGYLLRFARGSFGKSIREGSARLPLLLWHDSRSWPIGAAASWREADDGLYGVWDLDDSAEAQRAARAAADGRMTGLSVGWMPMLTDWEITDPADWRPYDAATFDRATLIEGRLAEVSLTPTPQFPDAQVSLVASVPPARHADARPNLDKWKAIRASLS